MTGNQLKILALITMTIDHVGSAIFPEYIAFRAIGRLTFPIFAYMIAEGCYYTHSKQKYLSGMLILAVLCQIVYFVFMGSMTQSIITTLVLSIITIYTIQLVDNKRNAASILILVVMIASDAFISILLPTLLSDYDFNIDYGFFGIMLPVFCYLPRVFLKDADNKKVLHYMLACAAIGIVLLCLQMFNWLGGTQWFSLGALVLLASYNGKRGNFKLKYLFYIYYPLHLIIIWIISIILYNLS